MLAQGGGGTRRDVKGSEQHMESRTLTFEPKLLPPAFSHMPCLDDKQGICTGMRLHSKLSALPSSKHPGPAP